MIPPELKTPNNLRRVDKDIYMRQAIISKGAIGYLTARTTIHHPARLVFTSLCDRYEFDVTTIEDIDDYLKQV